MANKFYGRTSLTGGGTGALDAIDGTNLADLDAAFVNILGEVFVYSLDADSAVAESSPNVIAPDANGGDKRWILQKKNLTHNAGITASTTQATGNGILTAQINNVSTVANEDDVVTLPDAAVGQEIEIINNGANKLQIFPASGEDAGAGVNVSRYLNIGFSVKLVCFNGSAWRSDHVTRVIGLKIHPGTTPNTHIDITVANATQVCYNLPEITGAADLTKDSLIGSFALNADGKLITMNFVERIIGFLGYSIETRKLNSADTGAVYDLNVSVNSENLLLRVRLQGTAANVDWTTIIDANDDLDIILTITTAW